jgi:hypothetical protein
MLYYGLKFKYIPTNLNSHVELVAIANDRSVVSGPTFILVEVNT